MENDPEVVDLLYTPTEVAHRLGIGRSKLYELLSDGVIPSVHVGSLRRVRRSALVAYIAGLSATK